MNYQKKVKLFVDIDEMPDRERPILPLSNEDWHDVQSFLDEEEPYIHVEAGQRQGEHLRVAYTKKEVLMALGFEVIGDLVRDSEMVFRNGEYVDDRDTEIAICDYELPNDLIIQFLTLKNIVQ